MPVPTDADLKSRLNVSLAPAVEPFDEVVAFTEQIINKNFAALFDLYPDMKNVRFDSPDIGKINATIAPSRIIIPGDDVSKVREVYYQIRFIKGELRSPTGLLRTSMDDWILTVPCYLETQSFVNTAAIDPKDVTRQIFGRAGDYSVERLFAQIATAKWNNPSEELSYLGKDKDGNRLNWKDWCKLTDFASASSTLTNILSGWAKKQQSLGRSVLGVKFTPKDMATSNSLLPSFTPTYLLQQIYPYISPTKGVVKGETNVEGTGLNCLLYCEMVDGHVPPTSLQLPHTGNFVAQGSAITGGDDQTDGCFALSYKHFLEGYFLPRLQSLNQAADVSVSIVKCIPNHSDGHHSVEWDYFVGVDSLHPKSNDPVFKFIRVPSQEKDLESVASYKFEKTNTRENPCYEFDSKNFFQYKHQATTKVTVEWTSGGKDLIVTGNTLYSYSNTWSRDRNFSNDKIFGKLIYNYTITWKVKIVLENADKGLITFTILDGSNDPKTPTASLKVVGNNLKDVSVQTPPNQEQDMRVRFESALTKSLSTIKTNLQSELMTCGKFVYPGNGTLAYANPCLNRHGNLLCDIEYLKLEKGDSIHVPEPEVFTVPEVVRPLLIPSTVESGAIQPVPRLEWKVDPPIVPAGAKKTTVSITAMNQTQEAQHFGYIQLIFTCGKNIANAFAANEVVRAQPEIDFEEGDATETDGTTSTKDGSDQTTKTDEIPSSQAVSSNRENDEIVPDMSTVSGVSSALSKNPKKARGGFDGTEPSSFPVTKSEPKVEEPSTTIQLETSPGLPDFNFGFQAIYNEVGKSFWRAIVEAKRLDLDDDEGGQYFKLAPGEFITFKFETCTSAPGIYEMTYYESWKNNLYPLDDLEGASDSDDRPLNLVLRGV